MTRICVFSDSHGSWEPMARVMERELPDLVIHLGDGQGDLTPLRLRFPDTPIHSVLGNCDWFSRGEGVLTITVEGVRIFAAHGHQYKVKYERSYQTLCYAALEARADLALFGHTHIPYHDRYGALELLNPGSIAAGSRPGYGLITIEGDQFTADLKRV